MNIHKHIKGDGVVVQMGRETIFFFFFGHTSLHAELPSPRI